MCRGRSCREPPTAPCPLPRSAFTFQPFLPFPDTPPSALEALLPDLPDRGNNRGHSLTPSPALLSWNQPRFSLSLQSFTHLVACGFPHSNLWFGVAQRMVSIFSLSPSPGVGSFTEFNFVSQAWVLGGGGSGW